VTFVEDPKRVEQLRPYVRPAFIESFDKEFYEEFGRWPAGSPNYGQHTNTARREKVATLAQHGATPGERAAASAALERIDNEAAQHRARMDRLDNETYE
jgi:hypothetical protein